RSELTALGRSVDHLGTPQLPRLIHPTSFQPRRRTLGREQTSYTRHSASDDPVLARRSYGITSNGEASRGGGDRRYGGGHQACTRRRGRPQKGAEIPSARGQGAHLNR